MTLAPAAVATPGPVQQRSPSTVTADVLPTAQINGIVWSVAVHGNTAWAAGKFSKARPAGAAPHTNEVTRNNFLSFSVSTGVLNSSFVPNLNAQALITTVSPDGATVYVGGDFTTANGSTRDRIAAYSTATGLLIPTFHPAVSGEVRAITVSADSQTVYFGGTFGSVNGSSRGRLAAVSAVTGALLPWHPTTDKTVYAMVVTPDQSEVILGGMFVSVDGQSVAGGLGAVTRSTGAFVPWIAAKKIHDGGSNTAILNLEVTSDGKYVIGDGFSFHGGGNLEGVFLADPDTGAFHWVEDCHGDTYGAAEANGVVYVVSHEHFCSNIGTFPDTTPRTAWYRSTAFTEATTGTLLHNSETGYADWFGYPSPSQINLYPYLATGNFSGAHQGAWAVATNSQYVVEGGEFPSVNGTAQEGLLRFGVPSVAPRKQRPMARSSSYAPTASVVSSTSVKLSIRGTWDRDDLMLTYSFIREGAGTVHSATVASPFWAEPTVTFTDSGLKSGVTYHYSVRVNDGDGNSVTGPSISATP